MKKLGLTLVALCAAVVSLPAGPARAATAVIHAPSSAPSLVLTSMQTTSCNGNPETQGTDGYVFTVGSATSLTVTGTPAVPGTPVDLDAYFIDERCRVIGDSWYGAYVVNAPVPAGTRYILVDLTLGAEVTINATW